jgi:predicted ATP-grasp superfamily ATP-dependent carboligase
MTKTPRVLITDGEGRASLAACRALRASGYAVDAVAATRPAVSHWSRSCSKRLTAPDPRLDLEAFADALAELLAAREYAVLLPGSDAALLAISAHRDRFGAVRTGLPSHDVVKRCLSKTGLMQASEGSELSAPETRVCQSAAEAAEAAREIGFPVLVKPQNSVTPEPPGIRQRTTRFVDGEDDLDLAVQAAHLPVLVQRRLRGPIHSLAGVRADGAMLAVVLSRYDRTWPSEAGPVSCSESLQPPPALERAAGELLDTLGWEGIFEIELASEEGRFSAIDLNPRVYGSLELANRAGAPLAAIWCDWVRGERGPRTEGRAGLRYRWEDVEARNLLRRLRSGRVREALAMLRPHSGTTHAHFMLRDPAPLLARAIAILRPHRRGGTLPGRPAP